MTAAWDELVERASGIKAMSFECDSKTGFSLVELVLVVAILAVLAVIAVPRFGGDMLGRSAVDAAARETAADMRLCRAYAVANASSSPQGYALRMLPGPPYPGYEIVNLATAASVKGKTFSSRVSCTGDGEFRFGPLGNLTAGSGTTLTLSGSGKQSVLQLTAATGSVVIEEQ